jgi:hypothetical protein
VKIAKLWIKTPRLILQSAATNFIFTRLKKDLAARIKHNNLPKKQPKFN